MIDVRGGFAFNGFQLAVKDLYYPKDNEKKLSISLNSSQKNVFPFLTDFSIILC